ncbi:mRNA-decapping enzyme 1A isoform X2 [Pimephales promelas]|uniref:mRNA-decapping enzyme 1A isoform X2 n=1 Tax=Pimephales promelas TaxID=90988 RepID=UPI0019554F4E|nr:mRNA-decapping enzyme 1A isoform X2 [Pimephales promelas]
MSPARSHSILSTPKQTNGSASPHHGFTIMNRLSTENLVEPINKDLEFQLQDPFLLYRNGNLGIYSIWFYDKADCQRIAQLMLQIVKQEAFRAQCVSPDRGSSGRTNGLVQTKPTDILELLSKAKEEYHRSQSTEREVEVNCESVPSQEKRDEITPAQQEKSGHSIVKQITVEELFGSSFPKDPSKSQSQSPAYGPPLLSCDPGGPALVSLFQTRDSRTSASHTQESGRRGSAGPAYMSPLTEAHGIAVPLPGFRPGPLITPQSFRETGSFPGKSPAPAQGNTSSNAFMSKEVNAFTSSPALVKPTPAGPVVQGEESSLLLSPSVFQHFVTKTPDPPRKPLSPTPPPTDLPTAHYNRNQLQDTLIHLIKNDAHFLSAIHEAYVQSISKGLNNINL